MGRLLDFFHAISKTLTPSSTQKQVRPLDYEQMHLLDAEDLAEGGIAAAYQGLGAAIRIYVSNPVSIYEHDAESGLSYSVSAGESQYDIYTPCTPASVSWGRATFALFDIVNRQLQRAPVWFYAINAGNDLGGMFLTPEQVHLAMATITIPTDWPYIPNNEEPWFGQHY